MMCATNEAARHLKWVNSVLETNLKKVEELSDGAHYCQLTNIMFPGAIKMKKVQSDTTDSKRYFDSWNALRKSFAVLGVNKIIPVHRLVRAKFHEHSEFLRWFKKFYKDNGFGSERNGDLTGRAEEDAAKAKIAEIAAVCKKVGQGNTLKVDIITEILFPVVDVSSDSTDLSM